MKKIEWKRIILDDKESNFMVSNTGIILNTRTNKTMGSKPNKYTGYRSVTLCMNGISHTYGIHVLVAMYFVPKPIVDETIKLEVNHKDGNKINNNSDNLEWVTRLENIHHSIRTGLAKPHKPKVGIEHWNAKRDEKTIHEICKMLENGYDIFTIERRLNVPMSLIASIKYHNGWSCISSNYDIHQKSKININQILPHKSKKYPEELVRNICKMLEDGRSKQEICKKLHVRETAVSDIKDGQIWRFYSEQYNIEYSRFYKPTILYLLVSECLYQDILDTAEIIEYHKLPDIDCIHTYIDNVKKNYIKQ